MFSEIRSCQCCGKVTEVFVCCSGLGPISLAYCADCLTTGREPWHDIVSFADGLTYDQLSPNYKEIVDINLTLWNKTIDDFNRDSIEIESAMNKELSDKAIKNILKALEEF